MSSWSSGQTHCFCGSSYSYCGNMAQVLEPDSGEQDKFFVWTRWGRVGESNATVFILAVWLIAVLGYTGQSKLEGSLLKRSAQQKFETKFKSKASGPWKNRDKLVRDPAKYFYLKGAYDFKELESLKDGANMSSELSAPPKPPECALHPRLQELIKLVCNVAEMERQMAEVKLRPLHPCPSECEFGSTRQRMTWLLRIHKSDSCGSRGADP